MNNTESISNLIKDFKGMLRQKSYSETTLVHYQTIFNSVIAFSEQLTAQSSIIRILNKYHDTHCSLYDYMPYQKKRYLQLRRYVVEALKVYHLSGEHIRRISKSPNNITYPNYIGLYNNFREHIDEKEYANASLRTILYNAKCFFNHLEKSGIVQISMLTVNDIYEYINSLKNYCSESVRKRISGMKKVLKFAFFSGAIQTDLSSIPIKNSSYRQTDLSKSWTCKEVTDLLNCIDKNTKIGKRNYAMILLAARLGIRSSDIKNLKLTDILWETNILEFYQTKTSKLIQLPLLKDVGWALIDYLRDARPSVASPFVFLSARAPFKPLNEKHALSYIIQTSLYKAGIPLPAGKKIGFHALRHTLASNMLENSVNVDDISAVLGHVSPDSTDTYLSTSIKMLRECCLEV